MVRKKSSESIIRDIKRQTKRKFSSEEKISIVIEGKSKHKVNSLMNIELRMSVVLEH